VAITLTQPSMSLGLCKGGRIETLIPEV